jgi:hypothetical protein
MLLCCDAECRKHAYFAECRYAECQYAECQYAECRYAECRGAAYCATHAGMMKLKKLVHFVTPKTRHKQHKLLGLQYKFFINFVQLAFNLSNGETGTLESSTLLIYFTQVKGNLYTKRSR